ncbi:hypothetical protein [Sphingomonas zeae]
MSLLTPALDGALKADMSLVFGAVAIDLPEQSVNLLDGAGVLSFGNRTFVGHDETFGTISSVEDLTDGVGDNAPAFQLSLLPAGDAAAANLSRPTMQGSPVMVWLGAVDRVTGQPIPDPYLVFLGELDVPTLHSDEHGRRLDYEISSVFERLFEDDQSVRLSAGHHRSIFPAEAGMDFVTGVAQTIYWGVPGVQGAVSTYSGGAGGYGGGQVQQ